MKAIVSRTLAEHTEALKKREYSAKELTLSYLEAINSKNSKLNAYITVNADLALSEAEMADERRAKGEELSKFDGIPYAAKDNISTEGIRTTCGSKMLENYIPPYDAHVIKTLKSKGFILLGKTNLDEFAMGVSTETSYFGVTSNPIDTEFVAGGSSGGSAAAVAADMAPFALGSDTGGSVRQPAAFCGVVGMRPTYGALSRYGLISFAPSLDQIGIITKNVSDNALIMEALRSKDTMDETSFLHPSTEFIPKEHPNLLKTIKVGFLNFDFANNVSKNTIYAISACKDTLTDLGIEGKELFLLNAKSAYASYYTLACAEASSNLARFDGVRYGYRAKKYLDATDLYTNSRTEGFGGEVKRRILFGTMALSSEYSADFYNKACDVRHVITEELKEKLEQLDVIIMPTAPTEAYKKGEALNLGFEAGTDDIFCTLASLAGLPAISVPFKFKNLMPVGIQLVGKPCSEALLYSLAHSLQKHFEEVAK